MHGLSALRTPLEMRSMPQQKAPLTLRLMLSFAALIGTANFPQSQNVHPYLSQ
jgi:hypothetical protein